MPLGQKQASMILIMPYHLEPLARLEKLLTKTQVEAWLSKMENRAVAISLPKVSLEVSHNLQVKWGNSLWKCSEATGLSVTCLTVDSSIGAIKNKCHV